MPEDFDIQDYNISLPALGEGTYGRVFRATYRGISDRALKIFRPGAVDISTMARELEKLSSVAEHHGIVTLHDFDLLNDPPYYAMGLHADPMPDGSWETRTLEKLCGHVDHREGWRIIKDIADAMAYLHRHQIVHCDLKPSNILLTDEIPHRTKICDFGQSRGLTTEGFEPVGTPLYASPEQLRDPRDSANGKGFRWDVYSFGVLAFKLITGEMPRLQELAEAERNSFDPEATLVESSLEATLADAEGRERIEGDRLATMTEAVVDIHWPEDVGLSQERKDLITRCLSLDPLKRPADMREVWNTMRTIDSNVLVKRARRLNALFGTLLVIAIWASGFAFVQAKKAREAYEKSVTTQNQAEELAFFIVNKLNHQELSGPGLEALYNHVANHSEAYLENLPKNRNSARLLRISANAASLRGREALEQDKLDEALEKFQSAYEIRAKLLESEASDPDLEATVTRDLLIIGAVNERLGSYDEAIESFTKAYERRAEGVDFEKPLSLAKLNQLSDCVSAIGRVNETTESYKEAEEAYQQAVDWHKQVLETASPTVALSLRRELVGLLGSLGRVQMKLESFDSATETYQSQLDNAIALRDTSSMSNPETEQAAIMAIRALGNIELSREEPEAALALFREEIKLLERLLRNRPNQPKLVFDLAEAYANAASCLDSAIESERIRAITLLQQAVSRISKLSPELREGFDSETALVEYNRRISDLLALEE